jgi:D-glycero-alpha-D-manno-heptose 1-phosphate guanylyltransferase
MEAIILAGGLGTRLRETVPDLPKPLAPIGARPFLTYLLDQLAKQGVRRVTLAVGHRSASIRSTLGNTYSCMTLQYSDEEQPLGTGGALRQALALAQAAQVFVLNGDTLFNVDLQAMLDLHTRYAAKLTLALKPMADTSRYGRVETEGNWVTRFVEKGNSGPGLINGGCYLVDLHLLDDPDLPEKFSFELDFLQPRLAEVRPLAFCSDGYFIDIGIPADYHAAQESLPALFG